tara:strand:+ start:92 stop:430 length:339 start_codon:yes stop_codon:yes gene_type:complete
MRKKLDKDVCHCLKTLDYTKDHDAYLVYEVWKRQMKQDIETISLKEGMALWLKGLISSPSSITRMRRKLQEQHEELRSFSVYEDRKNKEQKIREEYRKQKHVKHELGYWEKK